MGKKRIGLNNNCEGKSYLYFNHLVIFIILPLVIRRLNLTTMKKITIKYLLPLYLLFFIATRKFTIFMLHNYGVRLFAGTSTPQHNPLSLLQQSKNC